MPDSSEFINGFLNTMGIPLQIPAEDLFFGAVRLPETVDAHTREGLWELVFKIKTPSESNARALLTLFSVARLFFQRGGGAQTGFDEEITSLSPQEAAALLFANIPEQDGEFLILRVSSLDENRIALLFEMFSVYSDSKGSN